MADLLRTDYTLVVTGSRHGRADHAYQLEHTIRLFGRPGKFVCGGWFKDRPQLGFDAQAYAWAMRNLDSATVVIEYVRDDLPSPQCFGERDERMARHAGPSDLCLALPDKKSKGTWLTASMCFARGAQVDVRQLLEEL